MMTTQANLVNPPSLGVGKMVGALLMITRHRLNENNGGANASKGFIRCFEALYDNCSLIYPAFDSEASFISEKWKRYPCHDRRSRVRKGFDCYRGVLSLITTFAKEHMKTHHYDVVVIDHSFIGLTLARTVKESGARLVTIHHNVEQDYQRDNRKEYSLAFRLPYIHFAQKAERECLSYSDLNLTVTDKDAATFQSWYPQRDLHLRHWGIFDHRPIANKTFAPRQRSLSFVITGSLCFVQSLHPIMAFVARYWPLILQHYPQARLTIAGRNPTEQLTVFCSQQTGITVIPNPEDMAAVVSQADYYICPIDAGSGLKLRVMDGLKQGLPVICHEVSAAGYERLQQNGCLFVYGDEQTFVDSLHKMLSSSVQPDTIYHTFRDCFSVETGISRLADLLNHEFHDFYYKSRIPWIAQNTLTADASQEDK